MGAAVERLTRFVHDGKRNSVSFEEVREAQIEAMNERFQERKDKIKLVGFRAKEAGITEVRDRADILPLLLPHTAYKSYPESFLIEGKWDRLIKWLGTVSSYPLTNVDLDGIVDIDHWIERLQEAGHYVSCSSGTTGKSAMLIGSAADMAWAKLDSVSSFAWGSGVKPAEDRHMFGLAPVASVPRNHAIRDALRAAYCAPDSTPFDYPVPPITVGSITRMIALRKAIADGTAMPGDIAEFEATSAAREKALEAAVDIAADALIVARKEKLYVSGLWANLYKVAEAVHERGYSAKDFHPENTIYVGGGLKRAALPSDYREYVYETFNIAPERNFQMYGMQELGSGIPRCQTGGRYHIPPWLVCLPLSRDGDELLPMTGGEIEGRAAFFDLAMDGRWGGVISGDKMMVDFSPCECGSPTPSIRDNVARYADLEGDDKIGCAGTVDAYVRGLS